MSYMEKVRAWEQTREQKEPEPAKHSVVAEISDYDKYRSQIRRRGYATMKSDALGGEVIYLARDDKAAIKCPEGKAFYTESELAKLVKDVPNAQGLRMINEAKKTFPGSRIIKGDCSNVEPGN